MTSTGQRIRSARHMRQLSAQQLADRVHISANYLLKIEAGSRNASTRILLDLARVLHVNPEVLSGQPYFGTPEGEDRVQAIVPALRRLMLCYDSPEELEVPPRPLLVLSAEVDQISALRRDAQFARMGPLLPPLVAELTQVALTSTGRDQWRAYSELARAYRAVNSLAHKLGHHDLSNTALERVRWAADRSGDPLMQFTAAYLVAGAMLRQGAYGPGRRMLEGLRGELERQQPERSFTQQAYAIDGALALKLAMLEAREGQAEKAGALLDEAQEIASRVGDDVVVRETSFGPSQVRIHRIAALLDIGDTEQAVALPGRWGRDEGRNGEWRPPTGLAAERSSHHFIDYSSALLAEGQRDEAFASLAEARRLAPQHTRFHPKARDTVGTLVRLDPHPHQDLAAMARWMSS
ncbi:transcriptional regulator with XRE-family HTH domain [Kitasatospora sp. MAA4]|uniref:helix-turn-helix domain-containing protein n=1 Tax=Kitasatospora sp. MAA4 TaxID=3035093 RepID=UPI002475E320|nr:helix-turn-helix transcriptional regulator [Kitasatospora sp. MAA4]MDH6131805.1 transcriptional regulator with XRE-family HTH domain [Kitasatospora sp. MAA4]